MKKKLASGSFWKLRFSLRRAFRRPRRYPSLAKSAITVLGMILAAALLLSVGMMVKRSGSRRKQGSWMRDFLVYSGAVFQEHVLQEIYPRQEARLAEHAAEADGRSRDVQVYQGASAVGLSSGQPTHQAGTSQNAAGQPGTSQAEERPGMSQDAAGRGSTNLNTAGQTDKEPITADQSKTNPVADENNQGLPAEEAVFAAAPACPFTFAQLQNYDYLMKHFYVVHTSTAADESLMDASRLLSENFCLPQWQSGAVEAVSSNASNGSQVSPSNSSQIDSQNGSDPPQILIYHTHSQEAFADSGTAKKTIVEVGDYLTDLLIRNGFSVYHDRSVYDMPGGKLDRSLAYNYALEGITKLLQENPSIQVVIDLHRDGVKEGTRLVTEIDGKDTAQIMFFNGLSQTVEGPIESLKNPYRTDNLAFSLQLQLKCDTYYPGFSRKIFLKSLRYNQHLRPASCLIEAGAQTNTFEEVKNAMEPLAEVLTKVLQGK